tara:strand:- start:2078 stop:2749 length:672 start_codon:yes stop_codon:yes gene_type:complete
MPLNTSLSEMEREKQRAKIAALLQGPPARTFPVNYPSPQIAQQSQVAQQLQQPQQQQGGASTLGNLKQGYDLYNNFSGLFGGAGSGFAASGASAGGASSSGFLGAGTGASSSGLGGGFLSAGGAGAAGGAGGAAGGASGAFSAGPASLVLLPLLLGGAAMGWFGKDYQFLGRKNSQRDRALRNAGLYEQQFALDQAEQARGAEEEKKAAAYLKAFQKKDQDDN